jgi:hypothetical protein
MTATSDVNFTSLPVSVTVLTSLVNHARQQSLTNVSLSSPVIRDTIHVVVSSSIDVASLPVAVASTVTTSATSLSSAKKVKAASSTSKAKDDKKVERKRRNSIDGVGMDLRSDDTILTTASATPSATATATTTSSNLSMTIDDTDTTLVSLISWTCDVMSAGSGNEGYESVTLMGRWLDWIRRLIIARPSLISHIVHNDNTNIARRLLHAYRLIATIPLTNTSSSSSNDMSQWLHQLRCALFSINAVMFTIQQRAKLSAAPSPTPASSPSNDASLATLMSSLPSVSGPLPR